VKAIVCTRSGKPEVLRLEDVPKPAPGENEILVKVKAASVTRGDVNLRRMPRIIMHLIGLLMGFKPMKIAGIEFSGIVEATGSNVLRFKSGDEVFGTTTGLIYGANAEYVCVPETWKMGVVLQKPANLSFAQAAVIPVGAMTALDMFSRISVKKGQKVLVYGASGSVGTYAVQLARHYGAEVTAVCSTANLELVQSIGAQAVIDYTKVDFRKESSVYDVVFDAVGTLWKWECKKVLNPGGHFLTVRLPTKEKTEHLRFLKELAEKGTLIPVIDKTIHLEQVREAHRYIETGRKRGNVSVLMES
jgi:NADPH:quinone reductase-like Zn-dependent oxidoreductase